jgi:hypothetical protein
MNYI